MIQIFSWLSKLGCVMKFMTKVYFLKKHSFITLIQNYDPDIFVAVETWLCEEINDQSLFPVGYSLFRRDRSAHGGGVLIGIKSILSGQIIHVDKDYEFLICKFRINNQNSFV